jgi:hypothetical protein
MIGCAVGAASGFAGFRFPFLLLLLIMILIPVCSYAGSKDQE